MKRLIAVLLMLTLALGLAACKKEGPHEGMKNVAEDTARFYLYVPESWIEQREGASSPRNDGANVTAVAYLMENYYTPETYWTEKCLPAYQATFSEVTVDAALSGDTTLGGMPAKRYVYNATLGGASYRILQVITALDNIVYTLTYTATPDCFDTHITDVDSICAHFTFK